MPLRVWLEQVAEGWHHAEIGCTKVKAGFGGEIEVPFKYVIFEMLLCM